MGVFHVFKILQMILNRVKYHICISRVNMGLENETKLDFVVLMILWTKRWSSCSFIFERDE